ncbi:hypothetical protein KIN20_017285 [Parelaphostrongylus tenuis]|uniref:Uncharacterized protein n=1 Tax=Parelaphostrongylus tenuis TaxID=148309 RepID=A0AAD5MHR8_PARTN|nr:hypothetical protein KIN20_017285 [Parelaphostrongylus tenuis]
MAVYVGKLGTSGSQSLTSLQFFRSPGTVADTVKLMQNTYSLRDLGKNSMSPNIEDLLGVQFAEQRPLTSSSQATLTQTPSSLSEEKNELIFNQIINNLGNLKNICDKQFFESHKVLVSKEKQSIHDDKQSLEKLFGSVKLKLDVEREGLELQLGRLRRQAENAKVVRKEKASVVLKLRQKKTEELEAAVNEKDVLAQLASEFKKLDQESQGQIVEANTTIDQLEAILRKVHADLENACREMIHMKDDNDAKLESTDCRTRKKNHHHTATTDGRHAREKRMKSCGGS